MAFQIGDAFFRTLVCFTVLFGLFVNINSDIASEGPSIQDLEKTISEHLPEGLSLPINSSQHIPTQEEVNELLKKKCDRLGGPEAYEKHEAAQIEVKNCVSALINITELQEEIERAKPTGDLDTVFRKHCEKSPVFMQCVGNFTASLEPCMEEQEKESKRMVQNITESLLSFLCYKEGDRLALFIAEGGPDCLQAKQEEIQNCANETVSKYISTQDTTSALSQLPLLVMDEEKCESFNQFQKCVVDALETCSEPTPANIVESLFHFIVKMTPCQNTKKLQAQSSQRSNFGIRTWSSASLVVSTLLLSKVARLI